MSLITCSTCPIETEKWKRCLCCNERFCEMCFTTHLTQSCEMTPFKARIGVRGDNEGEDKTTGKRYRSRRHNLDLQKEYVDRQNAKNDQHNEKYRGQDGPGRPTDLYIHRKPFE